MPDLVTLQDALPPTMPSATVELFDPPMCCPTGVCGPTLDQALLDVNEMVLSLLAEGVTVARYQMATHPQAYLASADVMRLVREKQMAALPITLVHGRVLKAGAYPTLAEVRQQLNGAQA